MPQQFVKRQQAAMRRDELDGWKQQQGARRPDEPGPGQAPHEVVHEETGEGRSVSSGAFQRE